MGGCAASKDHSHLKRDQAQLESKKTMVVGVAMTTSKGGGVAREVDRLDDPTSPMWMGEKPKDKGRRKSAPELSAVQEVTAEVRRLELG